MGNNIAAPTKAITIYAITLFFIFLCTHVSIGIMMKLNITITIQLINHLDISPILNYKLQNYSFLLR